MKSIKKLLKYSCVITALGGMQTGCKYSVNETSLVISPQFEDMKINCGQPMINGMELSQFWFYLSRFKVEINGQWHDLRLQTTKWQQNDVALVGQHCSENTDKNWKLALEDNMPTGINSLAFSIAMPFNLNHQSPLKAEGIFDNANMFWTWQQGYKSLRLDLKDDKEGWAYHIGAVGCNSPSVMRAPMTPCRETNHVNVELVNFDRNKPITVDLARIIEGIALSKSTRCLSMPTQNSCGQLMINMTDNQSPVFYQ